MFLYNMSETSSDALYKAAKTDGPVSLKDETVQLIYTGRSV